MKKKSGIYWFFRVVLLSFLHKTIYCSLRNFNLELFCALYSQVKVLNTKLKDELPILGTSLLFKAKRQGRRKGRKETKEGERRKGNGREESVFYFFILRHMGPAQIP